LFANLPQLLQSGPEGPQP